MVIVGVHARGLLAFRLLFRLFLIIPVFVLTAVSAFPIRRDLVALRHSSRILYGILFSRGHIRYYRIVTAHDILRLFVVTAEHTALLLEIITLLDLHHFIGTSLMAASVRRRHLLSVGAVLFTLLLLEAYFLLLLLVGDVEATATLYFIGRCITHDEALLLKFLEEADFFLLAVGIKLQSIRDIHPGSLYILLVHLLYGATANTACRLFSAMRRLDRLLLKFEALDALFPGGRL